MIAAARHVRERVHVGNNNVDMEGGGAVASAVSSVPLEASFCCAGGGWRWAIMILQV
jgi:hypothetical protein